VGSIRLQLAVAREVIHKLEQAQDLLVLLTEEDLLQRELKMKCLSLASLSRTIDRQCSRLMLLREGDANTKFFHLQACHRGCKNIIPQLSHHGIVLRSNDDKAHAFFEFFDQLLGTQVARLQGVDFGALGMPHIDHGLDQCFSEKEF
jgi:hypothetical protein